MRRLYSCNVIKLIYKQGSWNDKLLRNNKESPLSDKNVCQFPLKTMRRVTQWCYHTGDLSLHYCDVIMGTMASQITSLTIVYSTVHSGADQRKHQSFASLAFVRGIHWWPMNPRTNHQKCGKCFHFMTSSWCSRRRFPLKIRVQFQYKHRLFRYGFPLYR